jgi:hypothetical protein
MNERYRCASLLKPLYAWVAESTYWPHAERAVIGSDNTSTDILITGAGGLKSALGRIADRTGVLWEVAETWGRVTVTAEEVSSAYEALVASGDPYGDDVLGLMMNVVPSQRFGVPNGFAVKAGWDLSPDESFIRTHIVVVSLVGVKTVLTGLPIDDATRGEWNLLLDTCGAEAVLPIHESIAGDAIRRDLGL